MAGSESPMNRGAAKAGVPSAISDASVEIAARFPPGTNNRVNSRASASVSLAEVAEQDLDAALQLLAERAQYITGAGGAAIALRRGQLNDMVCRASAGTSAPELGTLFSVEYGFCGESVRTCQTLFCKDVENDSRVNRESCRRLGIASVVVMPILCEGHALGVFELFSEKPNGFVERDLSALQRLCALVETAVKHAAASQGRAMQNVAGDNIAAETEAFRASGTSELRSSSPASQEREDLLVDAPDIPAGAPSTDGKKPQVKPVEPKPLYWSVAMQTPGTQPESDSAQDSIPVPPILRELKKCRTCGFPVSPGRTLCVECEEKQWKGQLGSKSGPRRNTQGHDPQNDVPQYVADRKSSATSSQPPATPVAQVAVSADVETHADSPADGSALFANISAQSESRLGALKFILLALLLIALIVAAIAWLR
jgi:hypothetical protein